MSPADPLWATYLLLRFRCAAEPVSSLSKTAITRVIFCTDPAAKGYIQNLLARELGVTSDQILDYDLTLYDTTPACLLGANEEFVSSGRIDDLEMVFITGPPPGMGWLVGSCLLS